MLTNCNCVVASICFLFTIMKKSILEIAVFFVAASMFAVGVNVESRERVFAFLISFIAGVFCLIIHSCNNALEIPNNKEV